MLLKAGFTYRSGKGSHDALKNGEEVLELLIEDYQAQGKPLPEPITANVAFLFV